MRAKPKKPRLIDDTDFLIRRATEHERKPEAWFRSPDHLGWLATLPCHICGISAAAAKLANIPVAGAHLRKGTDGAGSTKPSDIFVWPGCARCHLGIQHQIGEPAFFARFHIIDPVRMTLDYGLRSICSKTRVAAREEVERRYGRAA